MSILGFKMYQEWDKKEFEDFIKEYGFSVDVLLKRSRNT